MAIYKSKFTGQEIDDILTDASNVTNIEANPSGEATEELTKLTIGDTTYSIPEGTVVEGNPSGVATEELTKITIGDTTYSIPEGTVVEGNPSGEATVELTKLKIGNTIYSISAGGGDAKLYVHLIVTTNTTASLAFISKDNTSLVGKTVQEIFGYGKDLILVNRAGDSTLLTLGVVASFDDMGIHAGYLVVYASSSGSFSTKALNNNDTIRNDTVHEYTT